MRVSQYLLATLRETPSNTEIISHQLMLRSGMIRQLASGLYTWLPTGLRILKKVENIIREEMNNLGGIEISMPMIQPADLWKKSGRLEQYGPELFRCFDRAKRLFVLAPTHEEVITDLIRYEINSYKQLPLHFFQIQTKFRDEMRPRFGIVRSREFLMKDSYSFHSSQESLQETYNKMYIAYSKIFTRIGLDFYVIQASTDSIGGNVSHEFQIISKGGEGNLIFSDRSDYVENIEFSEALAPITSPKKATEEMRLVETSNVKTITDLVKQFNLPIEKTTKTILVKAAPENKYPLVAVVIRGDHNLNKTKVEKLPQVASPLSFANASEIRKIVNVNSVFLGPINIPVPVIIDRTVAVMSDFVAGANIDGKHYFGINWNRDVAIPEIADIRNVVTGDPSPDGKGSLIVRNGIEVGHIFQLGMKYSYEMNAVVQNKVGNKQILIMGCYGIGVTRAVAAIIEQNHDERGIIWPDNIAPFQVAILPINMHKSYKVQEVSEKLYSEMYNVGLEVLIDDRKECLGTMFADMELIGIPHIIVISDRTLNNNNIEYNCRRNSEKKLIKVNEIINFLSKSIGT